MSSQPPEYPPQPPQPPQYGLPRYGQPFPAAPHQRYVPPGRNGFAIAALVFSLIGGIVFSIVFGILALVQTRRSGQKGRRMAASALVLSGVWIVVIAVLVTLNITDRAQRDPDTGAITNAGALSAQSLRDGDCVASASLGAVRKLPAVPCSTPHQLEVVATLKYADGSFPGDGVLKTAAVNRCKQALYDKPAALSKVQGMHLIYFRPTSRSWALGDRHLTCAVLSADRRTGSIYDGDETVPRALKVGDCVPTLSTAASVTEVTRVDCAQPHRGEVYASLAFTGTAYPGDKQIIAASESRCDAALRHLGLPASALRGMRVFWFRPTSAAWAAGDRVLTCMLLSRTLRTGAVASSAS
jgi:hypothetical protein